MRLDFRIDWGYQILYSRRHYHPIYRWNGHLECVKGQITGIWQLTYPNRISGPVESAKECPLSGNSWQDATRRRLSGIRVEAEVETDTMFSLVTESGTFTIPAAELLNTGRVVFEVGPKYGYCHVTAIRSDYMWFRPALRPNEVAVEPDDLSPLPVRHWARMRSAWLEPRQSVKFTLTLPRSGEQIFHLLAMGAKNYDPEVENQVCDNYALTLKCDGVIVAEMRHYFRKHYIVQILEDVWSRFRATAGTHQFELRNNNPRHCLLINRLLFMPSSAPERELVLPPWGRVGEKLHGRVRTPVAASIHIQWPGGATSLAAEPGWNEFEFTLMSPGRNIRFRADNGTEAVIPEVVAIATETPEVMVGCDLTSVPHDDSTEMDWLLDYMDRTRLGNLVVFRSHLYRDFDAQDQRPADDRELTRWGKYCRNHHIHVEAATDFESGALASAAGEMMHGAGTHELTGPIYAWDPDPKLRTDSMCVACENYVNWMHEQSELMHRSIAKVALGDPSGGQRYTYLAGIDFIRAETMVPHTQHICALTRAASESLSDGTWAVHIATQHAMQPFFANQLGLFFLSLFQPWMMGCTMFYEEDSLFEMWKEERQAWNDYLTKSKRDMLRRFFYFVSTHPRQGQSRRYIAFLEGRYAAPFNGFICGSEQDPHYSVWGRFGNTTPEWGHAQPEKCRQLLDVLMPGACTHPLRQRFDRRRFFFSGTPYGDFDSVPIEAAADYLTRYRLLLNLGWNTLLETDYQKLCDFVRLGGVLLSGVPQFGTQEKRDFQDFKLFRNGDLRELCGFKISGPAKVEYSGQWNCAGRETWLEPELSALPSDNASEDGPCYLAAVELAGAEVVVWDADSGLPLLVRHRYGAGMVYVITAWAYPGHEALQRFSAAVLAHLAAECRGDWIVEDPSREVFWTTRKYERGDCGEILLLNTDWVTPGNCKHVVVKANAVELEREITERRPELLTVLGNTILATAPENYLEVVKIDNSSARMRLHAPGEHATMACYRSTSTTTLEFIPQPEGNEFDIAL